MAKQYQQKPQITTSEFGKLPPQSIEIEEAVLGAIISEKEAINKISLQPNDFYKHQHTLIFTAITNLHLRQDPIDILTLVEELRKMGVLEDIGGAYSIAMLSSKVSSAAHIEHHSLVIKQKSIARKLISLSSEVQTMAYSSETDVSDIIEYVEKTFTDISNGQTETEVFDIEASLKSVVDYMQELQANANSGISTGVNTGLNELNKHLNGGFSAPDLVIIGGRPSMGKTQISVNFAKNASSDDNHCLFCSLEMTKIQLILRMITEHEGIDFYKIKTGRLSNEEWVLVDEMISKIIKLNLFIADDKNIVFLHNIKSIARKMKRQGKLNELIIDYLQLIQTGMKFATRDLEVGYITRELKNLAKELNIPIILLAQLNRPIKGAVVKSPTLEDLRESGNIEQDADVVIFIHRPCYYNSEALDENGGSWKNRGQLIIAKNREGERNARVVFKHDEHFKKIWDEFGINHSSYTQTAAPNINFYETNNSSSNISEEDVPF